MATVTFEQASRIYPGTTAPAVDRLSLHIHDGEFLVLVGPSGCGKSTSLRMLAGLEEVDEGRILIGDADITDKAPKDRDIAMVFQNYALYPHMSVAENMGFALRIAGVKKAEIAERVAEAASLLDLTPYLKRKPKALSGGQRQRVAMGRAIVRRPQVFLMDEPLSNLDAKLRVQTRTQIAQLQRRLNVTTVYVTHDQVEAMTMGDRVAVMNHGVLQQVASPRDMYDSPANLFVAGFIGSPTMNFMPIHLDNVDGAIELSGTVRRIARDDVPADGKITLGVRPEDLTIGSEGIPAEVLVVEELGADAFIFCSSPIVGEGNQLVARVDGRRPPAVGDAVHLQPAPEHVHVFATTSGQRLEQLVAEPVVEVARPTVRPIRPTTVPTGKG